MHILITWASKRGGTEGIARILTETLRQEGSDVELLPAQAAAKVADFDAAVVGGALYAGRWPAAARNFVHRQRKKLREVPVWFFSSGPLDDSADHRMIPPTRQVQSLMDSVGAQGHRTFGGMLAADAKGFPAQAMAKKHAGDWRNPESVRAWAREIARESLTARPRPVMAPTGGSLWRLFLHATVGWGSCAAIMAVLLETASMSAATLWHAIVTPLLFTAIAWHYFRLPGARAPLPTALVFALIVGLLDLIVVGGLLQQSLTLFTSVSGTWLPLALVLLTTWTVGGVMTLLPGPMPAATAN
jgi:menaquinone-dependent protoporphyrinogen oxidase